MNEAILADPEAKVVGTTWPGMAADVHAGDTLVFADGALAGDVEGIDTPADAPARVRIRMTQGGELGARQGHQPARPAGEPPPPSPRRISATSPSASRWASTTSHSSFVRDAADVRLLRDKLVEHGAEVPIIAKIEKPQALEELDAILDVADGVMVARGDLGVEVPLPTVPVHQKDIIERAAARGRLVITATQMLDSMERNPRPTRAETTDVANAILDGTDAVMLSGETSIGNYPVKTVQNDGRHRARRRGFALGSSPPPSPRCPPWRAPPGAPAAPRAAP